MEHILVVWADGTPDTPIEVSLNRRGHQIAASLDAEGVDPAEIARRLNEMGILTKHDRPWTKAAVRLMLRRSAPTV